MSDMPIRPRRILVIDDNREIHSDFHKLLGPQDDPDSTLAELEAELFDSPADRAKPVYEVDGALQGEAGFHLVEEALAEGRPYAVAFVDMRMPPGWDGITTIEHIFRSDPEIQVVICTAYSEYSWEEIVARFPGSDRLLILRKPFDVAEVCQLAAALTEKWHLARRAHLKRAQLEAMVEEQTGELKRMNTALTEIQSRFVRAAAGARDGLWDWNLQTGQVYLSSRWYGMLGLSDGGAARIEDWYARVLPADRPALMEAFQDHFEGRKPFVEIEYRALHADGLPRWMLCRGLASRGADGRAVLASGSQTDITDRKLAEEQLRRTALRDPLTGLPNRLLLRERIERCIVRSSLLPDFRYGVLYIDLDRFKVINDTLGHGAGDELLRLVAGRLLLAARESEALTNAEEDPLTRVGGDEFVLLAEGWSHERDLTRLARRIVEILNQPVSLSGRELHIGCSVGIAIGHPGCQSPEEILRDADLALYHAKSQGRNRFEMFDGAVHGAVLSRWQLEGEIRAALGTGQFFLEYQPIVSLETGRLHGVEALIRWQHPRLGRLLPGAFISLAEETGLIVGLGLEALERGCRDLARWRALSPDLRLAVNLSVRQLGRGDLARSFSEVIAAAGVPPTAIDVEITESVLMDSDPARLEELDRLRRLGLSLHLDDFGTGYCSLSYLRRLRVDALKIDRSFVQSMGEDPMTEPIVRAIVGLAHTFGMLIVAEGIETPVQQQQLEAVGCDLAQGWLYGRPVPAEKITERLCSVLQSAL